jgi:thioredoxin-like negative regulator of GroEL
MEAGNGEVYLVFYHRPGCGVCDALGPKLRTFIQSEFPQLSLVDCDLVHDPAFAAQRMVFTVPVLALYRGEQELFRLAGAFSLHEAGRLIQRSLYGLQY